MPIIKQFLGDNPVGSSNINDEKLILSDGDLTNGKIWKGTSAEFDMITTKDPNTLYCVEEIVSDPSPTVYVDVYSADEVLTNKVYYGKKVYRKCLIHTLSSGTSTQSIPHGILNIENFVNIQGVWKAAAEYTPLPFVVSTVIEQQLSITVTKTMINIRPGVNRGTTVAEVFLEYTCTDR